MRVNAEQLFLKVQENFHLGVRKGKLYIYEDGRWNRISQDDLAIRMRKIYSKAVRSQISAGMIKEAIQRLLQEPALQLSFIEETEERFVNLQNGVFNAESGEMLECTDNLEFGYMLDFNYINMQERKMQVFEQFCNTTFPMETEKKRKLLLQMMGYVVSDYRKAKTGFFLIGESNSGKSVILELIRKILPRNTVTAIPLYRLENRFNIAQLADARVNINTEISEKSFKAVDIFKMLTSNEMITAEYKGKNPFEFRLRCKCINAGNVFPTLSNPEGMEAIINRMTVLLFPVGIRKDQQDQQLLEKLWTERDSIFSTALDELHELQKNAFVFVEPEDSIQLKKQMRSEGHAFEEFVDTCCVKESTAKEYLSTLYDAFKEFCSGNLYGIKMSETQFSRRFAKMQMQGIMRKKIRKPGGKSLSGVEGIRLKYDIEYNL